MLGLRWMCMHLWMNLIKRTIDIQEQLKIVQIYVQSQWRVVLLWYHIFWQSSIQRGRRTQLCIITSLKWIIQICSNFYCWVCKIAFYSSTHPIVVWGNLPFKWPSFMGYHKNNLPFRWVYCSRLLFMQYDPCSGDVLWYPPQGHSILYFHYYRVPVHIDLFVAVY